MLLLYQNQNVYYLYIGVMITPALIETFLLPGPLWNWTIPNVLQQKIYYNINNVNENENENNEEANSTTNNNNNNNNINNDDDYKRVYFDGLENQHKQLVKHIEDDTI
jgi:hypothetical protein